jgi:O-antigen ligase
MPPREPQNGVPAEGHRDWCERALYLLLVTATVVMPMIFLRATHESFRRPKDVAVQGLAILIIAIITAAAVLGGKPLRMLRTRDRLVQIVLAGLAWTALVTAVSTNQLVSLGAMQRVFALALIFLVTLAAARGASIHFISAAIAPAVVNALLSAMQELRIWNPFGAPPGTPHHMRTTGFIGNPNDVGTYLALAALASFVAAVATSGRVRAAYIAASMVIVGGLIASQTLTAIGALAVAGAVLAVMISWKRALSAIALAVAVLILVVLSYQPYRTRFTNMTTFLRSGNYNALLTNRLTPFASALQMIRDRPMVGVGPGCFGWQYLPYKVRAEQSYPELRDAFNRATNFGEVHNDHLQVAAEFGIPGYLLLLATIVTIASYSRAPRELGIVPLGDITVRTRTAKEETTRGRKARQEREEAAAAAVSRRRIGRLLALPLVVCFVVLAMTQFPLQLSAVSHLLVTLSAICVAWSRS